MNKLLNGFTIAELCVSMILSGIVVSTAYLAYNFIENEYQNYKRSSDQVYDAYNFVNIIDEKFWDSDSVVNSEGTLIFYNKGIAESRLSFNHQIILNTQNTTDTFNVEKAPDPHESYNAPLLTTKIREYQLSIQVGNEILKTSFSNESY